jgi:putative DNA primase/helicase
VDDRTTADNRYSPLSESELASGENGESDAQRDDGALVSPISADAPELPNAHYQYGTPTGRWAYRDGAGGILHWIFRFDPPGIRKQFLPLTLWRKDDRLVWRWQNVPTPRPLGLPR